MQAADVPKGDRQQALFEAMHQAYQAHYYDATSMAYREEFIFAPMLEGLDLNDYLVRNKPATFLFTVRGDSMIGASIEEGDKVIVTSADVKQPVAARYAWENWPTCNLYNGAGLPASPFRTDDWK